MAPVRSRRRLMGGAAALIALAAAVTTGLVIAGHSPSSGSVPGRVTGVSVAAGTYPAGVSWNAARSRGAPVLDYVVFDGSNAACRATPSHTDTNWCALYHVPLGRRFHVTVVAENRFGASMPSRTVAGFVGDAEVGPPVSGPLATYARRRLRAMAASSASGRPSTPARSSGPPVVLTRITVRSRGAAA